MIPVEKARELFRLAGRAFDSLRKLALRKDFRPVALGANASFEVRNSLKDVTSHNVVAKIEGSDPKLKDEYVIYTAHWDHLGRDPNLKGDQIYHGARDNGSGIAAMLEIAKAYAKLPEAPRRSILFIATTAEEAGLPISAGWAASRILNHASGGVIEYLRTTRRKLVNIQRPATT